ncbi:probable histone chaperone ASF1A [Tanacetum coccineum]|uniref:Probable histone chaperone ASF1A n=1 Tax=Tanacetum coccineum TaxID=301880 RepID=A0ABQ4XGP7_9ASTR
MFAYKTLDLELKLTYVGSATDETYVKVFESVLVGPINVGKYRFVFEGQVDFSSSILEPPELKEEHQVVNVFSTNAEDAIHALADVDKVSPQGTKLKGSMWWKETGTEEYNELLGGDYCASKGDYNNQLMRVL